MKKMIGAKILLRKIVKAGLYSLNGFPVKYWCQGNGHILMLHRVRPKSSIKRLKTVEELEITPEHLEKLINYYLKSGFTFLSMDELYEVIQLQRDIKKFVVITLDDGYHDNYYFAYPVFLKYKIPFSIYVSNSFPEGTANMWWYYLENLVLANKFIEVEDPANKNITTLNCSSDKDKHFAFHTARRIILNNLTSDKTEVVKGLFDEKNTVSDKDLLRAMSWEEIKELSDDPLVTIGCHTLNHLNLSILKKDQMIHEIVESRRQLTEKLKKPIHHFAFPFGTKEEVSERELTFISQSGFKTVVTSFKEVFKIDRAEVKKLPRLFLSGNSGFRNQINGTRHFLTRNFPDQYTAKPPNSFLNQNL